MSVMENLSHRAKVLIEALPYIRRYHGKTMVIKYGGSAMESEDLKRAVISDIVLLHYVGIRPIVVHGGGAEISQMMSQLGMKAEFVNGLRVTDTETMRVTEMVLGQIGKEIVNLIHQQGGRAVGLSGKDGRLLIARKMETDSGVDLGWVGDIETVNPEILKVLESHDFIPVISSVGVGQDGQTYNLNADHAAGKVAAATQACKLIMLTDVRGVYRNIKDEASLISVLTARDARTMIDRGEAAQGMIPKLQACLDALAGGVERAHIIDGRLPHAVLMEIFTDEGIGTMVLND
ncbi:MAG: acetylglutamate kinase [Abditibacteriales bacterium]|nr:acetylglutamate kinase [Abditibacteriales bacterium]MDW8364724.1 acetylglutamate kinase [Abditibacteriales bacterium]